MLGLPPLPALLFLSQGFYTMDTNKILATPTVTKLGWITTGLALARGVALDLQASGVPSQTDVLLRWDDGSVKFAAVTFRADAIGEVAISEKAISPYSIDRNLLKLPDFWACVIEEKSGERYYARPAGEVLEGFRLQGPLVHEWREVLPLLSVENGLPHPWLTVVADIHSYAADKFSMSAIMENCQDAVGGIVRYALTLGVGERTFLDLGTVSHPYLARTRQTIRVDDSGAEWEPGFLISDMQPFVTAGALPEYSPDVADWVDAGPSPLFSAGVLNPFMPDHGGRPEIAPYPDWAARALVHHHPEQLAFLFAQSDLSGSWPIHVREADGAMVSIDQRPNYWLDPRAEAGDKPAGNLTETGPLTPDIAHQPSLAFIPYMLTADRFYEEEMAFWANYVLLATFQDAMYNSRGGSQGLLHSNELRGIGWCTSHRRSRTIWHGWMPTARAWGRWACSGTRSGWRVKTQIPTTGSGWRSGRRTTWRGPSSG